MHAVVRWYYLARFLYLKRVPVIPQIIYKLSRIIFACDLKYTAEIGKDVGFFHNGLGVVVHSKAKIGDGSVIYQNVTIGGNGKAGSANGVPTIGSGVFIGAGAVILGPVTVGDGARIGANSVVLSDVKPYSTVVGIPAKEVTPS